jgi:hypothetical protein
MTIRDPEVLEALSEQPELLAIADAVAETQRLPRRSHRRAFARVAVVAAVGAAVLITLLLWPSSGKRNPILDRALAAIGDGPVLHLVVRVPAGQELVNLDTGRTIVPTMELESWSDRSLERFHLLIRENGQVIGEVLFPQDRTKDTHLFANDDAAYAALWSGYRDALRSGKAKIVREGSVDGRPVYWLSFESQTDEVAVDRRTYKPIVFRSISAGGRHADTRVLLMRTEPIGGSAFERQTSAPSPLEGESSFSSGESGPVSPGKTGQPWLRAGSTIAGLELTGISPTQTTTDGQTTNGFQLLYGSDSAFGGKDSLTIDEAKRPEDPAEWKGIPEGFMRISTGEGSDSDNRAYTVWTGNLVRNGVYVTITTGVSRAAVLEAARALRSA